MKLVKFIIVVLVLSLLVSFLSHAEQRYKRGRYVCTDESEIDFKLNPQDLDERYFHFSCEVIKGNDSIGLPELYILADKHSHLLANSFLADYLQTDGNLDNSFIEITAVDKAIKYRMQTQAIIKLTPNYPPEGLRLIEYVEQIELDSAYELAHLYLLKYNLGIIGDYRVALFNSPSYEGDKDRETYPDYNTLMLDSLSNAIRYAGECANLPQKPHFNSDRYQATLTACNLLKDLALETIPLEDKRKQLLNQCPDLNETNCPEYNETHLEINGFLLDYKDKYNKLSEEFL